MERERLKSLLARLHAELEETEDVDEELRALLNEVDGDIDELLEKSQPDAPAALSERARDAATSFGARHPRLESVLLELSEALGRMGI